MTDSLEFAKEIAKLHASVTIATITEASTLLAKATQAAEDAKQRLQRIAEIIEQVDKRCSMAAETLQEITQDEIREIYRLASNQG